MRMSCPVCENPQIGKIQLSAQMTDIDCPRCGNFSLAGHLDATISTYNRIARSMISHRIRHAQGIPSGFRPVLFEKELENWGVNERLPSPARQIDLLVELVAKLQEDYSRSMRLDMLSACAWIGEKIEPNTYGNTIGWLSTQNIFKKLFEVNTVDGYFILRLTMDGWEAHERNQALKVESRRGFMAMKFSDELQHAYAECFAPAVRDVGFEISTLAEKQPAGLIDDQLRVALRSSMFVIADLTFHNNGAYWEAGFAEGLGRRVIYTCRDTEWNNEKTHFDTNHLATIIWSKKDYRDARVKLANMIRATFPDLVKK